MFFLKISAGTLKQICTELVDNSSSHYPAPPQNHLRTYTQALISVVLEDNELPRDNKQQGLRETRWQQMRLPHSLDSSSHAVFTYIKSTDFVSDLPLLSSLSSHKRTLWPAYM